MSRPPLDSVISRAATKGGPYIPRWPAQPAVLVAGLRALPGWIHLAAATLRTGLVDGTVRTENRWRTG